MRLFPNLSERTESLIVIGLGVLAIVIAVLAS